MRLVENNAGGSMECEWGAVIGLWKKADDESFMGDQESTRVASRFSAPFQ